MSEIEALLNERAGYLARGRKDRAAEVAAELKRLGVAVEDASASPEVETADAAPKRPRKAPAKKATA